MAIFESLAHDFPQTHGYRLSLGTARLTLIHGLVAARRPAEAEAEIRRMLEDLGPAGGGDPPTARDRRRVSPGWPTALGPPRLAPDAEAHPLTSPLLLPPDVVAGTILGQKVAACYELAKLLAQQGREAEAEASFARIHELLDEDARLAPGDDASRIAVALAYAGAAYRLEGLSRHRDAEVFNRRALEMMERSTATVSSSVFLLERYAGEHFRRGRLLSALGRGGESAPSYRKAAELYETLAEAGTDRRADFRNARASSLNNVAWTLASPAAATEDEAGEAVRLGRMAVELVPERGEYRNTLGLARYRAGDLQGAVEDLTAAMASRQGGDAADWLPLAIARRRLGDEAEARRLYDQAVAWMNQHATNDPDLLALRKEAEAALTDPRPVTRRARGPD